MKYEFKLFSLLSEAEIKKVKALSEIRNVCISDLTVSELTELWNCLYLTKFEGFYSEHIEVKTLSILIKRYLIKHA